MLMNINYADQLSGNSIIIKIEELIHKLSNASSSKRQEIMDELASTILLYIGYEGTTVEDLFRPDLTPRQKAFIAASLSRLMRKRIALTETMKSFRPKAFTLMDDVFLRDDVYKLAKIDIKDQSYEKENRLCDAIQEIENNLIRLIDSVSNVGQLLDIRHEYMRAFNNKISKAIIHPFLLPIADESRLNTFFQSIKDYLESSNHDTVNIYEQSKEFIEELLEDAKNYPIEYSQTLIIPLLEKGLETITKDFESSPVGKPADIELLSTGKKYPLYAVGVTFNLALLLENKGPGYAREISYCVKEFTDNILITEREKSLGELGPGKIIIEIPCQVQESDTLLILDIETTWTNTNGQGQTKFFTIEVVSQQADINWENMARIDPYSLEPVTTEEDLIGRKEIIEQLTAKVQAQSLGSSFLYGQKRVGKTSIAKVLNKRIDNLVIHDCFVIYFECGNFLDLTAGDTVTNIGRRICRAIKACDKRFKELKIPDFHGALTPLTEFLEEVHDIVPEAKILFILDEFDELPIELFKRDEIGKAFFLPIRAISNLNHFGFLLVGGEKMDYVINSMGDQLNKFDSLRIDYFSRDKNWQDFEDLIKRPVQPFFEFSDGAINSIYTLTASNPYFTKLICKTLFSIMVKKHDAHITDKEINEAIELALENTEINSFQHFWQDKITEKGPREEEISIRRRKILISFGELARNHSQVTAKALIESCQKQGLEKPVVEDELREFKRRQILVEDQGCYYCKALFFEEWLKRRGIRDIMTSFSDYNEEIEERKKQELAFVTHKEINGLVEKWGVYQGRTIGPEDVRNWLNQFGDNRNQRLMFCILQNLRFYGNDILRSKMKEAHSIIKRKIVYEIPEGKRRKRDDILISYLDGPGKSGSQFARLYAQENNIYIKNVIEQARIANTLISQKNIKAMVFIDDLIGIGDSAIENIKRLISDVGAPLFRVPLFVIAVCGFSEALERVEQEIENLPGIWNIHVLDILTNKDKCFNEESNIFPTADERITARKIAREHGNRLKKKAPLGYKDVQANVVFESNCPNNCLPIIYKKSTEWFPLFERK